MVVQFPFASWMENWYRGFAHTVDPAVNRTATPADCGAAGLALRFAFAHAGPGITWLDPTLSFPSELEAVTVKV